MVATVFKPGDVVQLASGGPKMTLTGVAPAQHGTVETARCAWFTPEGEVKWADLVTAALVPVAGS